MRRDLLLTAVVAASCSGAATSDSLPGNQTQEPRAVASSKAGACPFSPEHTELFPAFEYIWPDCSCQTPNPFVGRCTRETALCEYTEHFTDDDPLTYRYHYNSAMILERAEAFDRSGKRMHEWEQLCEMDGSRPLECTVHGENVRYVYEGKLIRGAFVDGRPATFNYDSRDRLREHCRADGLCIAFEHDVRGRIASEAHTRIAAEGAPTVTLRYLYNDRSELTGVAATDGRRWLFARDADGLLLEITQSAPGRDPDRIIRETRAYDDRGRTTEQVEYRASGVHVRRTFRYDCVD